MAHMYSHLAFQTFSGFHGLLDTPGARPMELISRIKGTGRDIMDKAWLTWVGWGHYHHFRNQPGYGFSSMDASIVSLLL